MPFQTLAPLDAKNFLSVNEGMVFLMDVRTPGEFAEGHLENATNIPVDTIPTRLEEIPKDKTLVIYCQHGSRSKLASAYLVTHGYDKVFHIEGGFSALT